MAFRTNKTPVLQTKSASGSVATFNTALAMPLSSCNIAVNAWQEGSGDPSPSNVRAIHGFSVLNATRAGKNLLDKSTGVIASGRFIAFGVENFSDTIPNGSLWLKAGEYTFSVSGENSTNFESFGVFDKTGTRVAIAYNVKKNTFTLSNSGAYKISMSVRAADFVSWDNYDIQLEAGSTATAYEPYAGNIYTIQLGQEVYGAEVDVVNGVAHCTHGYADMGDLNWSYQSSQARFYTMALANVMALEGGYGNWRIPPVCEIYKEAFNTTANNSIALYNTGLLYCVDNSITTSADFNTYVAGKKICYKLATPFDIQLTPTQIETLIGNNTIFADTGDIDLTYKDLDIAKRGNYREVFKLPS